MADDLPVVAFASREAFASWLAEHDETSPGIWLKLAKKGSGIESVTNADALEVALCHGWIDGQRRALDDRCFLQRYTPRTRRSKWSKINRASAERLIASGAMKPRGMREVEAAKADGRWKAAYDSPANIKVPPDLREALDANPQAAEFFESLNSTNRYAILYRLHDATRPETRARRLEKFVAMLIAGEKLYP